ncbi:hypothetical protein DI53_1651 [Sphingobacterium deserti]|uniref:Uncharacterized protein n=1 Tax=Sphingobacterium deserti TaxID=1229276 RepID=A0A0B8T1A5_9SPHI|nr:hypothetical protein DI53_1651 [Sphingobacterium deserti]
MIKKRIHTLHASILESIPPYEDGNGNMIFPESNTRDITASCRAESGTKDGQRLVKGGVALEYSYLVFTDQSIDALPLNTLVRITVDDTNEVFGEGEVIYFERGQRVVRIWLS